MYKSRPHYFVQHLYIYYILLSHFATQENKFHRLLCTSKGANIYLICWSEKIEIVINDVRYWR